MKAPKHLEKTTADWWLSVMADYSLEPHHIRLLTLAAEAWDRGVQAREAVAKFGLTYDDRFGQPRKRPEVAVELARRDYGCRLPRVRANLDSRTSFARLLRELSLDVSHTAQLFIDPDPGTPDDAYTTASGFDYGTPIPEPAGVALLGLGAISLLGYRRAKSLG